MRIGHISTNTQYNISNKIGKKNSNINISQTNPVSFYPRAGLPVREPSVCFVFCGLLAAPHTFRQEIFDLPVNGTEILFRPLCQVCVKRGRNSQRNLLFCFFFCFRIRHCSASFLTRN